MNPSPLRNLVTRHVCGCRCVPRPSHALRLLSTSAHRSAGFQTPNSGVGNAEELRRRHRPFEPLKSNGDAERAQIVKRMQRQGLGILLCALGLAGTIYIYPTGTKTGVKDGDSVRKSGEVKFDGPNVPGLPETSLAEEAEKIPTGTSTIPFFPRTIHLYAASSPGSAADSNDTVEKDVEYHLLGLGIRTVSFLGIQVYVLGLYVAVPDIAALQERLIRTIDDVATTLVAGEKDRLKQLLMDPTQGEELWNKILKDGGIRTAFRIVPTRATDVMHMRDGFVRGITGRAGHFASDRQDQAFQDESFGQSLNDFKTVFGGGSRKKIPKGDTLYLTRDAKGKFGALLEDQDAVRMWMGEVGDERVSRLLWLNYLAGKSVSSEDARKNIVDGCMEIVSRPVGTVAAQVV